MKKGSLSGHWGIRLGMAALALLAAAWNLLPGLAQSWQSEEYSHCVFIPCIAAWLGWHRLVEKQPVLRGSWWAVAWAVAGCLAMAMGQLSAFEPLAHYGLWMALMGLATGALGMRAAVVLLPAFLYLGFAIPLPRLVFVGLSQEFQLWSSQLGVAMLRLGGISVFRDGNIIDLGTARLQVVEACSGLRYMFPLMSFGYLMAWLLQARMSVRVALFLSTVPIAIVVNALRIALIGVTVNQWGPEMATGLTHDMEGWTMFLLCIALLAVEIAIWLRISPASRFHFDYLSLPKGSLPPRPQRDAGPLLATLGVFLLAALTLGTGWLNQRDEVRPFHPPFSEFPLALGAWNGKSLPMEKPVLDTLKVSDYVLADYRKGDGQGAPVNFYIAYYASQRVGSSAHSPANCLPGSGWHIEQQASRTIATPEGEVAISRLLIKNGGQTQLILYWFDERGRILTGQYGAKWHLLWDSLLLHRTDGALVRLATPVMTSESTSDAENRMLEFLKEVYPHVRAFVPGRNP